VVADDEPRELESSTELPAAAAPKMPTRESDSLRLVLQDADLLFESGKRLFEDGEVEKARLYFQESLDLLKKCGFSFADYPEVEQVYYEILAGIRRIEMRALVEPEEPPFPILDSLAPETSPLDEIADLNLFTVEVDPALEDLVSEDLKQTQFDFPVVVNERVLTFLDYWKGRGRVQVEQALERSGRYLPLFKKIFAEEGVPQDLIYMAHVESLFKPNAYSRARARGIWQFVSSTARLYDLKVGWWLDERLDYYKATRAAARHLRDLHEEFGDWYLALAAYNGGPGRVSRVIRRYGKMDYWTMAKRRLLPRETRNFVPSILAAIIIYRHPERYGFDVRPAPELKFETVSLEYQVDLGVVADSIGVRLTEMTNLNPELQRGVTPFELEDYRLKIPPGTGDALLQALAELPPEKRLRLKHHRVRKGETLSHIASRYGISIRAIAEVNRIRNVNRLSIGQDLIIPLSDWKAMTAAGARQRLDAEGQHTVRRGESLYKISRFYGVTVNELFRWNNLRPGEHIHPGQKIRVSAETDSAAGEGSAVQK
jgi:membrane-bound lytic murein transglycosylase D